MKTLNVVAAIIKHDNKVLATKRGYGEFINMWEFPGGKIEPNETKEEALKLFEMFGMDASTAVNMFFKKVIQTKAIPFEISVADVPQKTTYDMSKEEFMGRVQSAINNRTV